MAKETAEQGTVEGRAIFATVDEARAGKPAKRAKWKLWAVAGPTGGERYLWADGVSHALKQVAGADGYSARCLDRKPMNPAAVSGILASLSPEERANVLAPYLTTKKGK
jgi:hypothetical protein